MTDPKSNPRWPLYDAAIRAGRAKAEGVRTEPGFYAELAPLTFAERALIRRFLVMESHEGKTYSLPSEAPDDVSRDPAEGMVKDG